MKKLLLVFSFIIPLLFSSTSIVQTKAQELKEENIKCDNPSDSIVRIINNYEVFKSNGFVYKSDDKYTYIITSSDIVNNISNYKVIYQNQSVKKATIVGYDSNNQVAILKTEKEQNIKPVCFANSDYLYKGQQNYAYGYLNMGSEFYIKTNLSQIGQLYSKSGYVNVYKNIVEMQGNNIFKGVSVFDELNRLIGMITSFDDGFDKGSYMTESNKLLKIADSIVKTGKYEVNYIKYSLVDYNGLGSFFKESYGVSNKVESGVVITTFKPLKYIFGGLNQGMTIVAVNGIKVTNGYELDKQLSRYEKKDSVCLKVIKKNGKEAFYHVKV